MDRLSGTNFVQTPRLSRDELLKLIRRQQEALAEDNAAIERRGPTHGPERGHVGVSRVQSKPDAVVVWWPSACAGCGKVLPETDERRIGQSQVTELSSVTRVVIAAWR